MSVRVQSPPGTALVAVERRPFAAPLPQLPRRDGEAERDVRVLEAGRAERLILQELLDRVDAVGGKPIDFVCSSVLSLLMR